jgi:hypothetical protein
MKGRPGQGENLGVRPCEADVSIPQTPAERVRRCRQRQRDGRRIAHIEIDAAMAEDVVLRLGLLPPQDADVVPLVDAAIARLVDDWLRDAIVQRLVDPE